MVLITFFVQAKSLDFTKCPKAQAWQGQGRTQAVPCNLGLNPLLSVTMTGLVYYEPITLSEVSLSGMPVTLRQRQSQSWNNSPAVKHPYHTSPEVGGSSCRDRGRQKAPKNKLQKGLTFSIHSASRITVLLGLSQTHLWRKTHFLEPDLCFAAT